MIIQQWDNLGGSLPNNINTIPERRAKPRITVSFPMTVRGVDAKRQPFEIETVSSNMSLSGIHFFVLNEIEIGITLSFIIRLSTMETLQLPSPRLRVSGTVVRVEPQPDGRMGVAAVIDRHQFI
ncbi:MAG: PilZ domain-containing protein [Terriglobia bacterium]